MKDEPRLTAWEQTHTRRYNSLQLKVPHRRGSYGSWLNIICSLIKVGGWVRAKWCTLQRSQWVETTRDDCDGPHSAAFCCIYQSKGDKIVRASERQEEKSWMSESLWMNTPSQGTLVSTLSATWGWFDQPAPTRLWRQSIWMETPEWIKDYTLGLYDCCEQLETERPVGSKRFALATGCRSNTKFVSFSLPRPFWSAWVSSWLFSLSFHSSSDWTSCWMWQTRQFNVSKTNRLMSLPKMHCKVNGSWNKNGSWNNFTFL